MGHEKTFEEKYRSGPLPCVTYYTAYFTDRWGGEKVPREGAVFAESHSTKIFLDGGLHDITSEYDAWRGASQRCNNEKNRAWKDYGGRGILFCFSSFHQFIEHLGLKPSPAHSLDRKDNEGHYKPGNVRWALIDVQANNKRNSRRKGTSDGSKT